MNLDNLNNLIELFANQANRQNKKDIFLEWLNPSNKKSYTWEETEKNILKLSRVIKENINEGDRCLLVSENRPEWFVSDLAIMVAGGITVPAYTTYTEDDYKYLIEDCEPSLVVVSNNEMLKKLNNTINEKDFIKKVITLDEVDKVTNNLTKFTYNKIIANLHEAYSFLVKQINVKYSKKTLTKNYEKMLIAMMPIIPHFSSECLNLINTKTVSWPMYNKDLIQEEITNIVVQINGKKRGLIKTKPNISENDLFNIVSKDEKITKYFDQKTVKKRIYIKGKIINIII